MNSLRQITSFQDISTASTQQRSIVGNRTSFLMWLVTSAYSKWAGLIAFFIPWSCAQRYTLSWFIRLITLLLSVVLLLKARLCLAETTNVTENSPQVVSWRFTCSNDIYVYDTYGYSLETVNGISARLLRSRLFSSVLANPIIIISERNENKNTFQ